MISSSSNDKQPDWIQTKSLRRFPENNNNSTPSNNNITKQEAQSSQNWLHQDIEADTNIQHLLSSSLMKPTYLRPSESDPTQDRSNRKSVTSDSSSNTLTDDLSFNHLIKTMSSPTKFAPTTAPKPSLLHTSLKSDFGKATSIDVTDSAMNEEAFEASVINKGEYLMKYQWNTFIGTEELKKYSKRIIERNDNIWEMVSLHYGCLNRLVTLRDVYGKSYPYVDAGSSQSHIGRGSSVNRESINSERHGSFSDRSNNIFESIESIVPGLDPLIKAFSKITNTLVNNHLTRPDRVITDVGRVLNESITDKLCSELARLYGHFNFQRHIAPQKISQFKKYPQFLNYILKCEKDPRAEKKTLPDYIQDISMFWARMTVPLNLIIDKTINDSQELNYLLKYKEKIQKLITDAENIQGKFVNAQTLKTIVENYEHNVDCKELSELAQKFMMADNATLVYKGEVQYELKKGNTGRVTSRDLTGVALENCLFFLQSTPEPGKNSCRYQLFEDRDSQFPAILEWGKLYGYFREEDSKNIKSFSFYVIIEKPHPVIKRFFVSTTTERNCWKNCMMQGFQRWQNENSTMQEAEDQLNDELCNINMKWNNSQHGIELIKSLDHSLRVQLEYRTVGFRCILEEELKRLSVSGRNSNTSTTTVTDYESRRDQSDGTNIANFDTYIPDLSTPEGINDWLEVFMEWVNRLKFSLCSSGANITRSASEIEARKRPSIQTVKKCETFTSHDSPNYEKRPTDVPFLNPPITKQKKDQRRISVNTITNLFRINSKSIKNDGMDKGSDLPNTFESGGITDKDITEYAQFDSEIDADSFMSSLSKDTVAAFNEINIASKNITMELIELRTKKITDETEIKKLKEENQSYRDFYKKTQKSSSDNQAGSNNLQKHDSIHTTGNLNAITGSGFGSDGSISESTENHWDPSINSVSQMNQMAECRRQIENLRQMYEQFANEKKKWEKETETQKMKIVKDKDFISEKYAELKREKEALAEKENRHKENCLLLQGKMDMFYKTYGINLKDDSQIAHKTEDKMDYRYKNKQEITVSPHSRSHSDEISDKRNSHSPVSPPLAHTETASYSVDSRHNPSELNTNNQIPDQLRGSLINQERQSLKATNSDNNLDNRAKNANSTYSTQKPKMTPSIERKELYCNSNACYSNDEAENKSCFSDVDDATFLHRKPAHTSSNKSISKSDERSSVHSSINTNAPTTVNRESSIATNQAQIPYSLATKTKVKKEKSKKILKK